MKLSVVIPTYNRKDSLRRTLDGLSRQQYPFTDFEAVVVSDGSTDGTEEMLVEYAATAPFSIRIVTQDNGGPSKARNHGIREAQYEVVVFLDDDVEPVPELLQRHALHHRQDENIAVIGPMLPDPARFAEEPAWIAWEHAKLQDIYTMFRPGGPYAGCSATPVHFYSGNASVRRKWLLEIGGFDENYTRQEDVELAVRLQNAFGVRFIFDFAAEGQHRPERTFASWLRIPVAYGVFDAQRVHAGLLNKSYITKNTQKRNSATRLLSSICVSLPILQSSIVWTLRRSAVVLYRMGFRTPALSAFSALYNVCYFQAFMQQVKEQDILKPIPSNSLLLAEENGSEGAEHRAIPTRRPSPLKSFATLDYSVLICTCNRGDSIVRTVQTILATDIPCTELIVIDQSDTDSTEIALAALRHDTRLKYIHTTIKGKSLALNRGLQLACCDIVAMTDDDVEVLPDWPQQHIQAFAQYPKLILTYGSVLPIEYDRSTGYIPDYYVPRDRLVTNIWQKMLARGIGANTAVRRSAVLEIGGFDPAFGPGGRFKAHEDGDMTIRSILNGHHVFESYDSKVYHRGFRNWEQGRALACDSFYGIGAVHSKALKSGRVATVMLLLWEFAAFALLPALWSTVRFRRSAGWKRVLYFLYGVWDGAKLPVDKKRLVFKN